MTLISAVLGTSSEASRDANTLALLDYGFANFHLVDAGPRRPGAGPADGPRPPGSSTPRSSPRGRSRVSSRPRTGCTWRSWRRLSSTARCGAARRLGVAIVLADGRPVARIPLLLAKALPAVSPLTIARASSPSR